MGYASSHLSNEDAERAVVDLVGLPQAGAEPQGLQNRRLRAVDVELLHVAADPRERAQLLQSRYSRWRVSLVCQQSAVEKCVRVHFLTAARCGAVPPWASHMHPQSVVTGQHYARSTCSNRQNASAPARLRVAINPDVSRYAPLVLAARDDVHEGRLASAAGA